MLLGYARTLLGLNDEIRGRFEAPDITGHVRLGVPISTPPSCCRRC